LNCWEGGGGLVLGWVGLGLLQHRLLYLKDLAGLEGGARQQDHGRGHVARLHAQHVGELVVPEVTHLTGSIDPRIPDD